MAEELQEGVKVRVRPARPFGGREGVVTQVGTTRVTVRLLPDGPEISFLHRDLEVTEEESE